MQTTMLLVLALLLLLDPSHSSPIPNPCAGTPHPSLCLTSLEKLPSTPTPRDILHISLNFTLHRLNAALLSASSLSNSPMPPLLRSSFDSCLELLDDSHSLLSQSLLSRSPPDILTWLSAALTNHDTCVDSLPPTFLISHINNLSQLISNCLSIFSNYNKDFSGIPIQNRRRITEKSNLPIWLSKKDRKLMQISGSEIQADFVVSKDGNGTHKSINDAVRDFPLGSLSRIVVYVKAGRYDENVKVSRKMINVMFVGDGKGKTIVAGSRSIFDNYTTFHTATFAASGAGFIIKDMTIINWAGPYKHQAVALRVSADHAVVFRCNIIGYQDTLYVHSQRQFFRECDIYGTVDFIFGNAAVVLQKCNIWARKPLPMQKITITAQNRKDPNQNTGISIHNCNILPANDLNSSLVGNFSNFQTFLGRPWKLYSRVVYLLSYMGGHIEAKGWLEWNQSFALDTLYYGEYMNYGPGADVVNRVRWKGFKVITVEEEAEKFTVANFIFGSSWLPSTGVSFLGGLSY